MLCADIVPVDQLWQGSKNTRCKPERGCKISLATPRITGAAGRNRTHDPLVRSQVLYPAELQPRKTKLYTIFVYFGRGKYLKTSYFASLAEVKLFFCLRSTKSATMPEQLQNGKPFLHLIVIFFRKLAYEARVNTEISPVI